MRKDDLEGMNNLFGVRLKEERTRLNLSQEEMAVIGGVKKNAQSNYERGIRAPDAEYLSQLQGYGVDTHYLITGRRLDSNGNLQRELVYKSAEQALIAVINVQEKLNLSFTADQLKNTIGYAYTAQASENDIEIFLRGVYGFMGQPLDDTPSLLEKKNP